MVASEWGRVSDALLCDRLQGPCLGCAPPQLLCEYDCRWARRSSARRVERAPLHAHKSILPSGDLLRERVDVRNAHGRRARATPRWLLRMLAKALWYAWKSSHHRCQRLSGLVSRTCTNTINHAAPSTSIGAIAAGAFASSVANSVAGAT